MDNYKWRASLIAQLIKNQPAMYKGGKGCPGLVTGIRDALTTRASLVAQMVKHLPAMQETWVRSLRWEDPLEKEMATHSSTLAW